MPVRVLQVPYDSGHRGVRMGAGPLHLVRNGAFDRLRAAGADVELIELEVEAAFPTEIGTAFDLHRRIAGVIAGARDALPLALSGNCNSAIGTVAGLQAGFPNDRLGVVWLDGHGDCSTPETFTGDFLDEMGLSTLTGRCWQALAATVPGFRPLADEDVVLVGGHAILPAARGIIERSGITHVASSTIRERGTDRALGAVLDSLAGRVDRIYLHLDVDVLDARIAPANQFAATGGLTPADVSAVTAAVARHLPIAGAAVASYDPSLDRGGLILAASLDFLTDVASDAREPGSRVAMVDGTDAS